MEDNKSTLQNLRQQEKKILQELGTRSCVGVHRTLAYQALQQVQSKIKYCWKYRQYNQP